MSIRLFSKIFNLENRDVHAPVVIILGLCLIGTAVSYFSIFIKTGLAVNIILVLPAAIYSALDFKNIKISLKAFFNELMDKNIYFSFFFLVLFFIILFETSIYIPKFYDSALYHAQSIHWIEKYKAVPGLGNFEKNLSYNNSWFLPSAFFSLSFLGFRSFHVLNGIFFLTGAFYFLGAVDDFFRKKKRIFSGLICMFVIPAAFYLYANFSSSPGTDMPTSILIWTIFILYIDKLELKGTYDFDIASVVIVALASYLITVKLSGIPVFLIAAYIIFREFASRKIMALKLVLLSCLIFIPWIIRSFIISGYGVYPVIQTGIFNFDWKVPEKNLLADIQGIRNWAFPAGNRPFLNYLFLWLKGLNIQYKFVIWPLFSFAALSLLYYLAGLFFEFRKIPLFLKKYKDYMICYLTVFCGAAFLFYSAPDVRFGAAIFTLQCLLIFIPALMPLLKRSQQPLMISKYYLTVLPVLMIIFEIFLFNRYFYSGRQMLFARDSISDIAGRILIPADYGKSPEGVSEYTAGDKFHYYIPNKFTSACWYDPFPCTSELFGILETRGESAQDGFRIRIEN
jgi:hypothetical protein